MRSYCWLWEYNEGVLEVSQNVPLCYFRWNLLFNNLPSFKLTKAAWPYYIRQKFTIIEIKLIFDVIL